MDGSATGVSKQLDYSALIQKRRACDACMSLKVGKNESAYRNQSSFRAILDADQIGNFSAWAHDLNAQVLIVGQDYANVETYERDQGRVQLCPIPVDAPSSCWSTETNHRLYQLVRQLGLDIGSPSTGSDSCGVFLTNAVLCLKPGEMNDPNPAKVYANCATHFLRRTIDVIEPRAVITLGLQAARATLLAYSNDNPGLNRFRKLTLNELNAQRSIKLNSISTLFPVYHPGAFGRIARQRIDQAGRDGWQLQQEDWRLIRDVLR